MAALRTADQVASAAADFLYALDRGDFGDLRIGPSWDRTESAYVASLRQALADYEVEHRLSATQLGVSTRRAA